MPHPRRTTLILAVVCLALGAACRRIPGPPWPRAFALDGHAPRVLTTAGEIAVPITLANTGTRPWDPAQTHLSYHWLWLVPRELATRRPVPYHDGIRTSLSAVLAPGARAPLEARLLAPAVPGLYWLQWDVVEEGVTWFSQVSPPQARQLVLVAPGLTPGDVAAPLPLLVALLAFWVLGRPIRRRNVRPALLVSAASGDVWWCAAVLFAKPLMLARDALLEPTPVAYWLIVLTALVGPLALWLLASTRVRPWLTLAAGVFGTLVVVGDIVYYRFFGDVLSAAALLGAHQTGRVWGSIRSLLTPGLLWLVADVPFAVALAVRLTRRPHVHRTRHRADRLVVAMAAAALVIAGLTLHAPAVLRATPLDQMFRDRAVAERLGPFGYHLYDSWNYARVTLLRPAATPHEVDEVRGWFASRAPLRAGGGALFGAARGRNLIVVQVESLQEFAVDHVFAGQEVMPHLRRWSDDALRFTGVTDQTSEGRTSDAEFASLVSLLPIDHGAVAFRYPGNHYVGMPRVLTERGYTTLSAVAFERGFWNRGVMHPSYGFQQSLFEPDFELTEQIGWGLDDRDFLQQMIPRLQRLPQPFCAWLITLSLHHPFDDFPDAHKTLKLGASDRTSFGNYLHTMRFFDDALEQFKTSLARAGLLDDTVLVVFGDHDAGFPRNAEVASKIGVGSDETSWALNDGVPFFIRLPGPDAPAGVRPITAGQTDFAPTLLALLGIDPAPLPYMGRNLLGAPDDPPILRPYGDWRDGPHLFLSRAASGQASVCYDTAARAVAAAGACGATDAVARAARDVSRLVVADDLQQRLRDALAGR